MCQQTCCAKGYKIPWIAELSWSSDGCSHVCELQEAFPVAPAATEEMLHSLENHCPCPECRSLTAAHIWGVHRWRAGPGWVHYSVVHVPAAADAGWVWRLYFLKCKVFSSSFSLSDFSKGKHLWMSLPEAITSSWWTWLSKLIDFTNGRRWAAYTTAPVLSPLHWDSTYQLSKEKKYRTSRDSLTSIFIPLLKKNRNPHHANSIYLRLI